MTNQAIDIAFGVLAAASANDEAAPGEMDATLSTISADEAAAVEAGARMLLAACERDLLRRIPSPPNRAAGLSWQGGPFASEETDGGYRA